MQMSRLIEISMFKHTLDFCKAQINEINTNLSLVELKTWGFLMKTFMALALLKKIEKNERT